MLGNQRAVEAAKLHAGGLSYGQIAIALKTCKSTVNYWLDPLAKQKKAEYTAANSEQVKRSRKRYCNSPKGKACRNRGKAQPRRRLANNLRNRLYCAFWRRRCEKLNSGCRDLGCSIDDLIFRFEFFWPQFDWDNYGPEWHIDHVKPLAAFNLENEDECLTACNFANLQPLSKADNLRKAAKWEKSVTTTRPRQSNATRP